MKRLGLLVGVFVLVAFLFNGGLSIQKTFAAVTNADITEIINRIKPQLLTAKINNVNPVNYETIKAVQIARFTTIANNFVSSSANTPSLTAQQAELAILEEYQNYLTQTANDNSSFTSADGRLLALNLVVIVGPLANSVRNSLLVSSGQQTQVEADQSNAASQQNFNNVKNATASATKPKPPKPKECGFFDSDSSILACIDEGIAWFIGHTVLEIAGWILWLAATLMNYSIKYGILEFAKWAPDTLYPIWILVRQIVSLFVVFAGLYLGFMYILGRENTFEKYIPWVIIFALFVNFSYPLVRTAVDISNVVSLNIYAGAIGPGALDADVDSETTAGSIIRQKLGLTSLVSTVTSENQTEGASLNKINSTPAMLLAVVYVLYAAYVLFMVAAIMILRMLSLIFVIVISPLLFVDSVIPKLGETAVKLRKILFEQLAVAPVFTVMLALTLKFLDVFKSNPVFTGVSSGAASTLAGGQSGAASSMFFNILMMIILLHIMLKVTKHVAGSIGQVATNAMGTVGGFAAGAAVGVATGGTGLLARSTLGRGAAALRDNDWVKKNQDSFIGRRVYDMSNAVAKSSFDLSKSSIVAGSAGRLGISTRGMGMGSALTGRSAGYDQAMEARQKDILDRGSRIEIRHKEDKYSTDAEGNRVLTARAGEIDKEATDKARYTYDSSMGGNTVSTFLMNDDMKRKTKELIKENLSKNRDVVGEKVKTYDQFRDVVGRDGKVTLSKKDRQAKLLEEQEQKLIEQRRKDPDGKDLETQHLQEIVNQLRKKTVSDEVSEFNKTAGSRSERAARKEAVIRRLEEKHAEITNPSLTPSARLANNESAKEIMMTVSDLKNARMLEEKEFETKTNNTVTSINSLSNDADKIKRLSSLMASDRDLYEAVTALDEGLKHLVTTRGVSSAGLPPGYTINPGGVIAVPRDTRPPRESTVLSGGSSSNTPPSPSTVSTSTRTPPQSPSGSSVPVRNETTITNITNNFQARPERSADSGYTSRRGRIEVPSGVSSTVFAATPVSSSEEKSRSSAPPLVATGSLGTSTGQQNGKQGDDVDKNAPAVSASNAEKNEEANKHNPLHDDLTHLF